MLLVDAVIKNMSAVIMHGQITKILIFLGGAIMGLKPFSLSLDNNVLPRPSITSLQSDPPSSLQVT